MRDLQWSHCVCKLCADLQLIIVVPKHFVHQQTFMKSQQVFALLPCWRSHSLTIVIKLHTVYKEKRLWHHSSHSTYRASPHSRVLHKLLWIQKLAFQNIWPWTRDMYDFTNAYAKKEIYKAFLSLILKIHFFTLYIELSILKIHYIEIIRSVPADQYPQISTRRSVPTTVFSFGIAGDSVRRVWLYHNMMLQQLEHPAETPRWGPPSFPPAADE